MSEQHIQGAATRSAADRDEIGVIDLLIVLAKHKRLIVWVPLLAAVIAAGFSLVLPPTYRASATLLPPQQAQSGAAALLSQLGGAAGVMAGAAGIKNPNDLYVGMLKSRTVADKLVHRFSLMKVYEATSLEKTRGRLVDNTTVTAAKNGMITIDVEDLDRERAAQLTNAYVDELMKLTRVLAVTQASQRRLFFERQLEQSKNKLAEAELGLKRALDTHGVISVDSETQAVVATLARLRSSISAKEIQLDSMQAFVTPNNQEYKRVQEELRSLKAELSQLENGRSGGVAPNKKSPEGLENIKVLREVKYHQMLYELLAKQYEMARLDEAGDSAVIQVLDAATVPEQRIKPKRTLIVLLTGAVALFLAVLLAFAKEYLSKLREGGTAEEKWRKFTFLLRRAK
jgi:tyrosine-protein kinase Etk/Wzc